MSEQIKVGDVWVGNLTKVEREVFFAGSRYIITDCPHEDLWEIKGFLDNHTLKKPEPVLKKLAAWAKDSNRELVIDFEDAGYGNAWTKKEIIIKDGALFVEVANEK